MNPIHVDLNIQLCTVEGSRQAYTEGHIDVQIEIVIEIVICQKTVNIYSMMNIDPGQC